MAVSNTMAQERWQRIQQIFEHMLVVAPPEREAWLAAQCGEDRALHAEVAALVACDASPNDAFEQVVDRAIAGSLRNLETLAEGQMVGRYRVLRLIGRGGMGAVYLAERADQQFDQQVALKLIGSDLPRSTLARRFKAERQILAQLNHPNIAHLLDGGATDEGVPYLAMEYIEGTRIDVFCAQQRLDIPQRLRLFQQVCSAVQYAHQNLIVHRDIKPSNILIAAGGTPKLLDFGIAKLLVPQQTGATGDLTRIHERVLTPEHASPEQIRGEPIGTVSDVYSLGVLLYELLSGVPPYSMRGCSVEELEQLICTVQPPRPSVALTLVEPPPEGLRALQRALAGDLDNIVMRAMHKDVQRRYSSAALLSHDIDNYLDHRPVLARPDAWSYRLHKFFRRNLRASVMATVFALLLISLVTFYTVRLAAEGNYARLEAAKSAQVARFLTDVFRVSDPSQAQGRQVTAIELLDQGARDINTGLAHQPLVRADLLSAIGLSYKNLSEYERAGPLLEESLSIRDSAGLERTAEFAKTLYELANLRRFQGRFDESERHFKRALDIQQQILEEPHADTAATLTHLGVLYYEMERAEESLELQQRALAMTRAVLGENHAATADRMNNLALVLQDLDRHAEAERHLRECIRIQSAVLGVRHPDALTARYNLALVLRATGRYREAEATFRELLPTRMSVLGDTHPNVGYTLSAFGGLLTTIGKFSESERALNEALDIATTKHGETHWRTAGVLNRLGLLELARGNYTRAQQLLESALQATSVTYGENSPSAHRARTLLAAALTGQGEHERATQIVERSYEELRAKIGMQAMAIQQTLEALAEVRVRQGRLDEATILYRTVIANYERVGGAHNPDAAGARLGLAQIASIQARHSASVSLSERALADLQAQLPPDHWRIAVAEVALGQALQQTSRAHDGASLIRRGNQTLIDFLPQSDPRVVAARAAFQSLAAP